MTDVFHDGINDDMHTHSTLGAGPVSPAVSAPVGTEYFTPPFVGVPEDTTTPRIPRENYLTVVASSSTTADPHPAYAADQTAAATPGGAVAPLSAPSPETWQQRALKMLLEDNASRQNTRYQVLSAAEVLAIETILSN